MRFNIILLAITTAVLIMSIVNLCVHLGLI